MQEEGVLSDGDAVDSKSMSSSSSQSSDSHNFEEIQQKGFEHDLDDECEAPSSLYEDEGSNIEPVDFEIDGLMWVPPEPLDEEDEREALSFDDDDDGSLQLDIKKILNEQPCLKEDFTLSPSDNKSILVSLSSRCEWKGTVCERSHLFRIEYYGSFDKPLGRFLRDHLFDQNDICHSCEMPAEAHVQCYTHTQGTLSISVKMLPEISLPGEKDGKIWMWHRCLSCPRVNGFPPPTRRIVMSDDSWGLSFGKFLELSFLNHEAVASCGHSLHRDCLRYYGFGNMVASFRYASIDVHSVYLPPPKLDFNYESREWIAKELNEVVRRAELLFSEVCNALHRIIERNNGVNFSESRLPTEDLEGVLQKEKSEFEETLEKIMNKEAKKGKPDIDILELNRLRRQLIVLSSEWDHRLIHAGTLDVQNVPNNCSHTVRASDKLDKEDFRVLSTKRSYNVDDTVYCWLCVPFVSLFRSLNGNFSGTVDTPSEYNPELQSGVRLLLPVGVNDIVIPVYYDEPSSIISYALVSPDYSLLVSDEPAPSEYSSLHARVSFADDGPHSQAEYSVTCYYAKGFEALRRICCPSEVDFVRSLSRCEKWGASNGESKTLDGRFIVKQMTKPEMESFIKFAPDYFKYLSESIGLEIPTCLAKILGVYQVTLKHLKGGKETKTDVLVMKNHLFGRNVTRLYDLKGSSRSRYNPDSSGSNKVLLDQNLIEAMPTSPIFVGNEAKRLLERAIWNDTSFLASIDVMDYSLLVGVDEEKHELAVGIVGYMRKYTWDKSTSRHGLKHRVYLVAQTTRRQLSFLRSNTRRDSEKR